MSYLRLLVDYRPEECPKCQFSVTEVFFIFFHLILSLQGGGLFFSPLFLNSSTLLPLRTA